MHPDKMLEEVEDKFQRAILRQIDTYDYEKKAFKKWLEADIRKVKAEKIYDEAFDNLEKTKIQALISHLV